MTPYVSEARISAPRDSNKPMTPDELRKEIRRLRNSGPAEAR